MCEKMSVYAGEKRDQVNILRLCCGCGVCGFFACCGCGVCGVFAAVLPRQYLHDASDYAVGAVLEQVLDDRRHVPVAFWSRVLAEGQRRKWTSEKRRRMPSSWLSGNGLGT